MALQAIVRCVGVQYRNHYKESVLHVAMGWRRTAEMTKQTYTRSNLEQKITYSTASVIDGSAMARSLNAHVSKGERPPALAIVRVGDDPASLLYVRTKLQTAARVGMNDIQYHIPSLKASEEVVLDTIEQLNKDGTVDGIILQLPLPRGLNKRSLIQRIDKTKDVDGLHACNVGNLISACQPAFRPCTSSGIMHALRQTLPGGTSSNTFLEGKHCVVVGASSIVGKPLAMELVNSGGTVTIATKHTGEQLRYHVSNADILIVATGHPQLVPGEWVKQGSVVIDVGCHPSKDGLVGEVQLSAWNRAAFMTPGSYSSIPITTDKRTNRIWLRKNSSKHSKLNGGE